jgi:hypothetical protein
VLRPSSVPIEVRQACWDQLWRILLREPSNDDVEQQGAESRSEPGETDDAAACATSEMEVTMSE